MARLRLYEQIYTDHLLIVQSVQGINYHAYFPI